MSKLIIITGHLAALKTTIAKRLSNDLHLLSFIKDDIKEILGDHIGFQNREENLKLSKATFQLQKEYAKQALAKGQHVIVEGNFKVNENAQLKELVHDDQILSLFLTAKEDVLYERYLKRQTLRHQVHTSTGLMSFDTFKKVMAEYHFKDCIGDTRIIDTTFYNDQVYDQLFIDVKNFIAS